MISCLMYVAVIMPFIISFVDETQGFLKLLESFIDIVFIIDMVLNFFVAYQEEDELVTSNKKIALHYLKGWFLCDLVASLPTSQIVDLIVDS